MEAGGFICDLFNIPKRFFLEFRSVFLAFNQLSYKRLIDRSVFLSLFECLFGSRTKRLLFSKRFIFFCGGVNEGGGLKMK